MLTVDGAPVISTVVEGTATFGYERGEFIARAPIKAGERFPPSIVSGTGRSRRPAARTSTRTSAADCSSITWKSSVPFNPSKQPPPSYRGSLFAAIRQGASWRSDAAERFSIACCNGLPPSGDTRGSRCEAALVALAQKEGDSFEEGIRLALEAVLASPDFLFRIRTSIRHRALLATTNWRRGSPISFGRACPTTSFAALRTQESSKARGARSTGPAHAGRWEGSQPGRELCRSMAAAPQSRPHQAGPGTFPDIR